MEPEYFLVCTGAAKVTRKYISINPSGLVYIPKFLAYLYRLQDKNGAELMVSHKHRKLGIRFLDKPTESYHYRVKHRKNGAVMISAPAFLAAVNVLSRKHQRLFKHEWDEEGNVLIIRVLPRITKKPRTLKP